MPGLILFNKPYAVLSQFTDENERDTLADFLDAPKYRAAGRLDYDSEGLLLLTDDGQLQQHIANPRHKVWKTYLVHVEGVPEEKDLERLRQGVELRDGPTLPARANAIAEPAVWPRTPPVRKRLTVKDSWIELGIQEGRNRQVRRMTAAIGFPTLRLIRWSVGDWNLDNLAPGAHRKVNVHLPTVPRRPAARRALNKKRR